MKERCFAPFHHSSLVWTKTVSGLIWSMSLFVLFARMFDVFVVPIMYSSVFENGSETLWTVDLRTSWLFCLRMIEVKCKGFVYDLYRFI